MVLAFDVGFEVMLQVAELVEKIRSKRVHKGGTYAVKTPLFKT